LDFHLAERLPQLVTADVLRAAVLSLIYGGDAVETFA
jgi:hypothetical protein